jgi:hypothetical protein
MRTTVALVVVLLFGCHKMVQYDVVEVECDDLDMSDRIAGPKGSLSITVTNNAWPIMNVHRNGELRGTYPATICRASRGEEWRDR